MCGSTGGCASVGCNSLLAFRGGPIIDVTSLLLQRCCRAGPAFLEGICVVAWLCELSDLVWTSSRQLLSCCWITNLHHISSEKMTIVSELKRSNERTANATTSTAKNEFPCPACPTVLTTAHELTNHILSHNSSPSSDGSEDEYTCGVCHKVLSSASSLTRHVYVHSGEKPFKCKYCEMAFSTNGNMNRHHRTAHREMRDWPSMSCTDSDSSDDSNKPASRRQADEYNNNEVRKSISPQIAEDYTKRKHSEDEDDDTSTLKKSRMVLKDSKPRVKARLPKNNPNLACPVCENLIFGSSEQLDDHLKTYHSAFVIKCDMCERIFNSKSLLSMHKFVEHYGNGRGTATECQTSVEGFNDLTFVDFSSDKFPAIARAMCEQSLHRPASAPAYECPKCARGFPCKQALDSHKLDCGNQPTLPPTDIKTDHSKRNDFFAGLNLQNRAAAVEAREGKDLADIQSIISTASEPIFPRSDRSTPDQQIKLNPNVGSSGSSGGASEYQEETQDAFAVEFRKMKLKGEFPCRLCDSKFQNLRALKGHNRQHLNVPSGMPFPCSMCPYQHPERGALMKHLRDHNGDRPYECSICNYAFTTKANCERHVRNRHGKQTREEIKSVLIYHPSEDITNEGVDRGTSPRRIARDDARRTIIYPEDMPPSQLPFIEPNDLSLPDESVRMRHRSLPTLINPPISHYDHTGMFSRPVRAQEMTLRTDAPDEDDSKSSDGSVSLVSERQTEVHQRLHSPVNLQRVEANNDSPLDLSMDVLDLSKKSRPTEEEHKPAPRPVEDNTSAEVIEAAQRLLLARAIIAEGAQGRLGSIYNNAPLMYSSVAAFPGAPAAIQPYLYNSQLFNPNLTARRDRDLTFHLTSGGSMIEPTVASSNFPAAYPQQIAARARSDHSESFPNTVAHLHNSGSERGSRTPSSNSSVKMVIKNGVLMPKQKQRRYRTEKPYVCEICDAKFTLRSNMERHIKHQHPKRWSQRPRGGHSTRGRPPANPPSLVQNSSLQPNHQLNFSQFDQADNDKPVISTEVKNAILAQHLKGTKRENESEDEGLIIDEAAGDKASPAPVKLQPTTSLLRGKLEEHVNFESEKKYDSVPQDFSKMDSSFPSSHHPEIRVKTEPEASEDEEDTGDKLEKKMAVSVKQEDNGADLASVSELLDNASQQYQQFRPQYISDEEGLVASTSDCNISGSDDKSDSMTFGNSGDSSIAGKWKKKKMTKKKKKKMSAYSMAPNKVLCTYCERTFPWQSSLRRHILTHTGHKPFQCAFCGLLFTTKSNCDRHLMRKHRTSLGRCRMKHSSSPEATNTDSNKFAMRNVPERPYKCNRCPSSTFSTLGNLKKHRSAKHSGNRSRPESPVSDTNSEQQETLTVASKQREDNSGEDSQSSISEPADNSGVADLSSKNNNTITPPVEAPRSRRPSPRSSPGPADGPFKCHLCDCGFAERQDCLDHIKESHVKAYELLMNKGALDMDTENVDEHPTQPSDPEERRGKFPDYSNRKVVCAFCMRRFWSAEDLRRHMRTHTGERPYSCDICSRRFTLKHSMLRHRKKHESVDSTMYVGTSGDEETVLPAQLSNATRSQQQAAAVAVAAAVFNATTTGGDSRGQERMSLPTVATVATGDAAPSGLMRYNPYENLASFAGRLTNTNNYVSDATAADGDSDLISNLLGIGDRNIIEQVLHGSPDDAAKILGVNRSHD